MAEKRSYGINLNHTSGTRSNYYFDCKGYTKAIISVSGQGYTQFRLGSIYNAFPSASFEYDVSGIDTLTIIEVDHDYERSIALNVTLYP